MAALALCAAWYCRNVADIFSSPRPIPSEALPMSDSEQTKVDEESTPSAPVTEQAQSSDEVETSAAPPAAMSQEESPRDAEGLPASSRLKIGTQREEANEEKPVAQPQIPAAQPAPPKPASEAKHYPPPNVRTRLTPEQEAELEEALGGQSLDDLLAGEQATPEKEIPEGTRLTAKVAKIYQDHVFIDLGPHQQGTIAVKNFEDQLPEPGSAIDVMVARFVPDDGLYELTLPHAAVEVGNWDEVEEGQIVDATITGVNKGGLECQVSNLRGFMPMGQISIYRVENPEEYVGQRLPCVVTEANRDRRNLVLSHRAVMERQQAENREKFLKELAPGQLREGTVRSVRDFGAFVDLGGIDGMIHVSKLSWDRVNHPSEVLSEGQAVKVKIDKIDPQTGKISLSYRDSAANPWDNVEAKYGIGTRIDGTVSKLMDFGAFVKLEPGVEGLIHISELAHGRVMRTSDVLSEGQKVEVKVLSVDREKQRISLSLKALLEPPKKKGEETVADEDLPLPPDAPKPPKKRAEHLKGGIGQPSGGEKFGLKW